MKRLTILVFFVLFIVGCESNSPARPTTDRCLALHTSGLPECSPPTSAAHPSLTVCPTTSVWTGSGLEGETIRALAIDPATPTTLYAGTSAGVFKSTDGGENWRTVNNGLANVDVRALAIDSVTPTTLYAGTWGGGVFKSTDGGENWNAFNMGLVNLHVFALAIDPVTPTTIYAGTDIGVFAIQ
jgi:photosystem II stability/assembly factor-like uncharacterized protein